MGPVQKTQTTSVGSVFQSLLTHGQPAQVTRYHQTINLSCDVVRSIGVGVSQLLCGFEYDVS